LQLVTSQVNILKFGMSRETYVIANGPNQKGVLHSVVYQGDAMVHDPNPDKGGLAQVTDVLVFVVVNPARMKPRRCKSRHA
jgi:hypothetical protein